MNLQKLDLNLFKVFDAIYTTGSLTKAAESLFITQPAVSNSLNKLRVLLDDPLFERRGNVMVPTAHAHNIINSTRQALSMLTDNVQKQQQFTPESSEEHFRFTMSDLEEAALMPRLMAVIKGKAPLIKISNQTIPIGQVPQELQMGRVDFLIHSELIEDPRLSRLKVAQDRIIMIARKDHPKLKNGLSPELFSQLHHVDVANLSQVSQHLTEEMGRVNLSRQISLQGQHFLSVPVSVIRTDLVACVPYHFAKHFDVDIFEVPFTLPFIEYYFYWPLHAENNAAHSWMRDQMQILADEFSEKVTVQAASN